MEFESFVARGLQVLAALGGAYLLALWFVLIVWTFRDIEMRSRSVVTQVLSTLLVVLFWIPGLMLYWILRPKQTLDDTYQRSLEEEYLLQDLEEVPVCPSCQRFVADDYRLCPHCQTALRDTCVECDRLIDLTWQICPYCGTDQDRREVAAALAPPAERWVAIETAEAPAALRAGSQSQLPANVGPAQSADSSQPPVERLERLRFARAIRPNGQQNGAPIGQDGGTERAATTSPASGDTTPLANHDFNPETPPEPATVPRRFKVES